MTVYLDIVLLENIVINYVILFTTGAINKIKTKVINLCLASFIGAIYAVLSFTSTLQIYEGVTIKILLSIAMVYIAYRPEKIKLLFRQLMLFYLVSFAFGGTAFALLYFIRPQDILLKNGLLIGTYPIKIAFLGAFLGFTVVHVASKGIKNKINKRDMFCNVEINIENKMINVKAMIDTGNLLKEPITGIPVVVIETSKLRGTLPEEVIEKADDIINGNIGIIEDKYAKRLRVIPFTSLGKQNGMLLGIKADEATIKTDENSYNIKDVIIGMYNKSLTKNGMYNALIGLDILEGGTNELVRNAKTWHK